MPELPEVQTTVNGLNKKVKGLKITDVWTDYGGSYHIGKDNIKDENFFKKFKKKVVGQKILNATRRAKNVLIHLSENQTILVHMKMTGHLMYGKYTFDKKVGKKGTWSAIEEGPLKDPFNKFLHFVITLSNKKQLVLSDTRKFAKITLIETANLNHSPHLKDIGPEIMTGDFDYSNFKERLMRRPIGRIKNVLMDQSIIAGVGNIYSDEALWRSSVHPEEKVKNIPETKLKLLFTETKKVLEKGIDFGGDSMSDYRNIDGERGEFQNHHMVYRRKGEPCKKSGCNGIIIRRVIGGRSAHFCDTHQKLLKNLDS